MTRGGFGSQCLKLWKLYIPPVEGLGLLASGTATQPIVFTPTSGKGQKKLDLTETRFRSSNVRAEPHTNVV